MLGNQKGFTLVEIILAFIIAGVMVLVGWFAWGALHTTSSMNNANVNKAQNAFPASTLITITLIDKTTSRPVAKQQFVFRSNNGTPCVTAPCDDNEKSYKTTSNGEGVISVPSSYVQQDNSVESEKYLPVALQIVGDRTAYEVRLSLPQ